MIEYRMDTIECNKIDVFPMDIKRDACMKVLEKNQSILLQETRAYFTNVIRAALNNCEKSVSLTFDDRLWSNNRIKIAIELLERFGEFIISTQGNYVVTKSTNNMEEIPKNIKVIKIEF